MTMEQGKGELVGTATMTDVLPKEEQRRLFELEMVIKTDLAAFLRVGAALAEIKVRELYRGDAFSFEEYLKGKWGMGQSQGYRLIDSHTVVESLKSSPIGELLPINEAQVRPLTKFKDNPEILADIWTRVVGSSVQGKITAKLVQDAVFAVTGEREKEKVRAKRAKVDQNTQLGDEFKAAFDTFMEAIAKAKAAGDSQEAIIEYLEAAIEVVKQG